ncbi:Ymd8p [Sugiyamaella lignohabitans]|uniref:Ymd8p n=1 Tax=Sugiyamaella lignohabitans TaxID=796027 RepID=A0A167CA84_9ASCO|nr:Ymd8p [Sugiyamaella lignohabitans]ANB11420.1 Ymd8p [Sugiyamaella lignohabitans]
MPITTIHDLRTADAANVPERNGPPDIEASAGLLDGNRRRQSSSSSLGDSSQSISEKESQFHHAVMSVIYILGWYLFSVSISVYNKWMFSPEHLDFRFPIFSTSIHQLIQTSLAAAILFAVPEWKPQSPFTNFKDYFRRIGPCAAASAGDIGMGNVSLRLVTLSFYTMVKSSSLGFVLLFGVLFKIEKATARLCAIIIFMSIGVLMMVAGETQFQLFGFILVMGAAACSGLRWSLTQLLLKPAGFGRDHQHHQHQHQRHQHHHQYQQLQEDETHNSVYESNNHGRVSMAVDGDLDKAGTLSPTVSVVSSVHMQSDSSSPSPSSSSSSPAVGLLAAAPIVSSEDRRQLQLQHDYGHNTTTTAGSTDPSTTSGSKHTTHSTHNNPIYTILSLSPIMGTILMVMCLIIEGPIQIVNAKLWQEKGFLGGIGLLIFPGILAFCMTLSEFLLLNRTSVLTLAIAGICKEVVTICVACIFFGDRLTFINGLGLLVTTACIGAYNLHRYNETKTRHSAKHLEDSEE